MNTTSNRGTDLSWSELPAAVTTYLSAQPAHDTATAAGVFAVDAVVTDDGRTYHGRDRIRGWLDKSAGEYGRRRGTCAANATSGTSAA